jgi:hypothetical protein
LAINPRSSEGGWSFNVKCAVPTSDERTVELVETLHDLMAHPARDDDDFDATSEDAKATEPEAEKDDDVQTGAFRRTRLRPPL